MGSGILEVILMDARGLANTDFLSNFSLRSLFFFSKYDNAHFFVFTYLLNALFL